MTDAYIWWLFAVLIAVAVAFIVIAILWLRRTTTVTQQNNNTLQNNYDIGSGNIDITTLVKPFTVQVFTRPNIVKQAATFSNPGTPAVIFPSQPSLCADKFTVADFMNVVSLQLIAGWVSTSNPSQTRTVGIFDVSTGTLLVQADVSVNDAVEVGFFTHALDPTEYVLLTPGITYCIVSVNLPGDRYTGISNTFFPCLEVELVSDSIVRGASALALPDASTFAPSNNTLLFASFQVQKQHTPLQNAFYADNITGFSTVPPKYCYGLLTRVLNTTQVSIGDGVCSSNTEDVTMHNRIRLIVDASNTGPNGLDIGTLQPNTWYHSFLLTSRSQNQPELGVLSLNRQDPNLSTFPIGYDSQRRTGFVLTDSSANLIPTYQIGKGQRRQTFYPSQQQVFSHSYTALPSGSLPADIQNGFDTSLFYGVNLNAVAPAANTTTLSITTTNPNSTSLFLYLRPRFSTQPPPYFLTVPLGTVTQRITIVLLPFPIPHAIEAALVTEFSIGSDVLVTMALMSFEHDL